MKQELEIELVKKYPKILRDYRGDMMETCMSWGMECDDGWYNLLDECMAKLQYFCKLCSTPDNEVDVRATQIKEKYGRLCFYYDAYGADELQYSIIEDIIDTAERQSERTCEITGEWGEPCHRGGWYKTLCYEEARKLGYKACDESTEKYWKEKDERAELSVKNDSIN